MARTKPLREYKIAGPQYAYLLDKCISSDNYTGDFSTDKAKIYLVLANYKSWLKNNKKPKTWSTAGTMNRYQWSITWGLIMTEMAEAVEADRNDRRADMESFNERMSNLDGSDECFKEMYKRYIKGSIEEEFADVVIRVLDMAQEAHGDKMRWLGYYPCGQVYHKDKSFIENAWYFIRDVLNWGTMNISDSVSFMFDWAQDLGIDLWQHIEWKMKYNKLRPYKHGGKKY